jgi:WD40 repeat protein/biotin carboxyl carrier protein
MFRWLAVCVVLAAGVFAAFALFTGQLTGLVEGLGIPVASTKPPRNEKPADEGVKKAPSREVPPSRPKTSLLTAGAAPRDAEVTVLHPGPGAGGDGMVVVINDARLLPAERQEVPAERDGKLIVVGRPLNDADRAELRHLAQSLGGANLKTHEEVVKFLSEKKLGEEKNSLPEWYLTAEVGFLAVAIDPEDNVPASEQILFPRDTKVYRRWREGEPILPDVIRVGTATREFRKLQIGDRVEEGQMLALINPELAVAALAKEVAKLNAAEADRRTSEMTMVEARTRYERLRVTKAKLGGGVSDEEYRMSHLTWERYKQELRAKHSAVVEAQLTVDETAKLMAMHEIHSVIPGIVREVYRHRGEAVKNLESVLQLKNPNLLRVEGLVEVQDAKRLRALLARGKNAVEVIVEASRPDPPLAVLKGHLHRVTAVAVSKGKEPVIVSGSEDHTVRLWKRASEAASWRECCRIDHFAVVKSVACTGPKSKLNLALSGAADGVGRLIELTDTPKVRRLEGRHEGAVNAVAFRSDGTVCATGGDDRAIYLWNTQTGERLGTIRGAHKASVTSLHFAGADRLVSAGRDQSLNVWDVTDPKNPSFVHEYDRRSGNVADLGVNPDGTAFLFDQGRELRVRSLADGQLLGSIENTSRAGNFATMALFSPDGQTVLTNGTAPGQLQLWRASTGRKGRGAELRQYIWSEGSATSGAFAPEADFLVTGTEDNKVLVWTMPSAKEVKEPLYARLMYVDEFQDTSMKKVPIRAELRNPGWLTPGGNATLVIRSK